MKLTFAQILNSVPAFRELQQLKLPPKVSLDIYKMGKELERELKTHQDLREGIFRNHSVPESDKGFEVENLSQDKILELSKDLNDLQSTPVQLDDYEVDIDVFERFDVPISAAMLSNLEWFIKDKTVEVPKEDPIEVAVAEPEAEKAKVKRAR